MGWHEAVRLARELLADPSSRTALAVTRWPIAVTAEYFAIADLIDVVVSVFDKDATPYRRITDQPKKTKPTRSRDEVLAILAAARAAPATPSREVALPIRR